MSDAAHHCFRPQRLPVRADFNGKILDAQFAQQHSRAHPAGREFLPAFLDSLLQVPGFGGIQRARIAAAAQFRNQCAVREQLAQARRQTRGMGFDAMH